MGIFDGYSKKSIDADAANFDDLRDNMINKLSKEKATARFAFTMKAKDQQPLLYISWSNDPLKKDDWKKATDPNCIRMTGEVSTQDFPENAKTIILLAENDPYKDFPERVQNAINSLLAGRVKDKAGKPYGIELRIGKGENVRLQVHPTSAWVAS